MVWSKPEKGGKPFAAKILATHQRSDQPIYRLKLKNLRTDGTAKGETLLVTPSHPFYVPAKRDFIPALDLKPGDLLQSLADGDSENTSSQVEALELYLPVGQTYNLTVDVGHTFYVGELKTWVHNTGPCDLPEWPVGAKAPGKDYVDILSPEAKQHILYGDKPGSGGHMWPGQQGKTVFPESWSGEKIVHAVGDIATSPSTKWYAQTGTGGLIRLRETLPSGLLMKLVMECVCELYINQLQGKWLPHSLMMLRFHLVSRLGKFYVCR